MRFASIVFASLAAGFLVVGYLITNESNQDLLRNFGLALLIYSLFGWVLAPGGARSASRRAASTIAMLLMAVCWVVEYSAAPALKALVPSWFSGYWLPGIIFTSGLALMLIEIFMSTDES